MKTVLVSHDALVDTAPAALTLVIRLKERESLNLTLELLETCRMQVCVDPHSFLSSLGQYDDDTSLSPAARAAHALHQTYRTLLSVKTHNEIDLTDVEALLTNTCGHQSVEAPVTETTHNLDAHTHVHQK